ncbi:MAG TPA: sulfotransferase [Devosia sp.]|nr:sulfotransferase [Devosia sp.]
MNALQHVAPNVGEAWVLLSRGDYAGAAQLSGRVLRQDPGDVSALCCNAVSNWQLGGDIQASLAQMRRAVEMAPNVASVRHNFATILASNGEIGLACENFRRAIDLKPDDTEAFYALTQNHTFREEEPILAHMLDLYAKGGLSRSKLEFLCFGLARAHADLGRYARAMHFCVEANWLANRPYDAAKPRAELTELRRLTISGALRHVAPGAEQSRAPLFIVGMPRSGTTLVETILARHPEVHAGGEMLHMLDVEQALLAWARENRGLKGGPHEMLRVIPPDYFTANAEAVLKRVSAAAGRPFKVFTDKLPENSQRLGLIAKVFPNARVIHVRRHPLDCCISNFFQRFALGHGFAFRQDLLGERYRQVAETMQLWKRSIDLPILDVSYEALVSDPDPNIRRIVAFAGLDWDAACLTPEKANRTILTASQYQVKQPINRNSVDRWRVYQEWIGPLIEALGGLEQIEAEAREIAAAAAK